MAVGREIDSLLEGMGKDAADRNVKIGLELHGGFLVHTPATLLRLREAVGEVIGANLDPSHLWWQGIDPVAAIKILGKEGAIHHFHAKDTYIDPDNVNMYGLTDMQSYANMQERAWLFRTVGYGHDLKTWADILSALRTGRLRLCGQHRARGCPLVHRRGIPQGGGKLEAGDAQRIPRRDVVGVIGKRPKRLKNRSVGVERRIPWRPGGPPPSTAMEMEGERRHDKSEGGGDRLREHR